MFWLYDAGKIGYRGYKEDELGNIDFDKNARTLLGLIEEELRSCEFEDPQMYNTLGL